MGGFLKAVKLITQRSGVRILPPHHTATTETAPLYEGLFLWWLCGEGTLYLSL